MSSTAHSVIVEPLLAFIDCASSPDRATCFATTAQPVFVASLLLALGLGLLCYVLSFITGNDSWVDRTWSIVPPGFGWFYIWYQKDPIVVAAPEGSLLPTLPTLLGAFTTVTTIWGIRLTYNFWRRGGYQSGGEDYRWEHVRKWPMFRNRVVWQIFSFGFISVFQQLLLWAITLPMLSFPAGQAIAPLNCVTLFAMLTFIAIETTADQQQWNFQNEKRKHAGFKQRAELKEDYARGFLTHGLFGRSRHPNVWAEQQIWITLYTASMMAWSTANWSALGCLALVLLTARSCALTEELSLPRHPEYKKYQKVVPTLVPSLKSLRAQLDQAFLGSPKQKSKGQ